MKDDFLGVDYLKDGNERQREAFRALSDNGIMAALAPYSPLLAGTVPIGIDIPSSDLDIVCKTGDRDEFIAFLGERFGDFPGFGVSVSDAAVVCRFDAGGFPVEIYGAEVEPADSRAFRHMLVEHEVLSEKGARFRDEVVRLKENGMKTEPAFARLLGIDGDPYEGLLEYGRLRGWL